MARDGLSMLDAAYEPGVAELPAIFERGNVITYGQLAARVRQRARDLAARGVGLGSRVALRATCDVETIVSFFALIELGVALVPIHPRLTDAEEQALVDDAHPDLRLSGPVTESLNTERLPEPVTGADVPAAIVYTSGTTGRPKGAVLSRKAFVASARASETNLGWHSNDRWLVCMPLAHVGGLSILTRSLLARKPIVLEPRFDPEAVLRAIRRDGATQISVVPTMLDALLEADRDGDLARLRFVLVGGAAASPILLERAAERGLLALTTYGLTEACSQVTCQALRQPGTLEPGSGRALPGVELRIVREDGGAALANEVGFIEVRGPNLMSGYFAGPDKPPTMPTTDGWFATGDMGAVDELGRLFVHARRTDLIVTGGENVYPAEVEQALEQCAGVASAVVFGVPDARWGQIVVAALVLNENGLPENERAMNVIAEASNRLAPHKRPRLVAVLPTLRRTPSGKIDRMAVCRDAMPRLVTVSSR
ncbi:MAG: AMP-binding protein [Polyangiaceae bacterium]|nr:AMP-binding protein [Polyangiaceae bacterium]